MIITCKDKETEKIWRGQFSKRLPAALQRAARRKLIMLHSAIDLNDVRVPPGNRLHALSGDRKGQHSIAINDQWRICFTWRGGHATDVEITDYH